MQIGFILVVPVTVILFTLAGLAIARRGRGGASVWLSNRNSAGSMTAISTLVASMAGAWILFSPAETATWAGISGLTGYALGSALPFVLFAWLAPRLRKRIPDGHGLSDYTRTRFGSSMHFFTTGVILFYMYVFLTAELTGIALVGRLTAGIPLWITAAIIAVGTAVYAYAGGIRASVATDRLQFAVMVPILILLALITIRAFGGWSTAVDEVRAGAPALLNPMDISGLRFGLTLVIAVVTANMFHQGLWQRAYNCRDVGVLRRSFLISGLLMLPIILGIGIFGFLAASEGLAAPHSPEASTAVFSIIRAYLPVWIEYPFIVLAVCLVMSSLDTLQNGLTCTFATFTRTPGETDGELTWSRRLTLLLLIPAVLVASQGYSVLYLFLIADLVASACLVPVFAGLFSDRLTGRGALAASWAGILAGVLYFPRPDFTPLFPLPGGGDTLHSFGIALVVSGIGTGIAHLVGRRRTDAATVPSSMMEKEQA